MSKKSVIISQPYLGITLFCKLIRLVLFFVHEEIYSLHFAIFHPAWKTTDQERRPHVTCVVLFSAAYWRGIVLLPARQEILSPQAFLPIMQSAVSQNTA